MIFALGILSVLFVNKAEAGSAPPFTPDSCLAVCLGDDNNRPGSFIIVGEDANCSGELPDTIYNLGKRTSVESFDLTDLCPKGTTLIYIPFVFAPNF